MSSSTGIPIVCRPGALTVEQRQRSQTLRRELATATQEVTALPDGYAFQYPPDAALFQRVAEWISLERRCCPFLSFELTWARGDETPSRLSVTGPRGTKAFLSAQLPELPHADLG